MYQNEGNNEPNICCGVQEGFKEHMSRKIPPDLSM